MPRGSGWIKLVSIVVVCSVHLALLAGFNHGFVSGDAAKPNSWTAGILVVAVRVNINTPLTVALSLPDAQTSKKNSTVTDARITPQNKKSDLPVSPIWPGFPGRDYFLDTDAVDVKAQPGDDFETALVRILPLHVETVVLEFWIEKDGRTLEVRCLEGACNNDVLASLTQLADLAFTPARKNGTAVGNRKVIQINIKPGVGL